MNTVDAVLDRFKKALRSSGFDDPGKEARALMAAVAGISVEEQILRPGREIDALTASRLDDALSLRLRHVSIPHIAGEVSFDGHTYRVNRDTLVPRPETEILVGRAFEAVRKQYDAVTRAVSMLDTFTGSGAVGVALGIRCLSEKVPFDLTLVDASEKALAVAKANAEAHLSSRFGDRSAKPRAGAAWHLEKADIWPRGTKTYAVITANPPYVRTGDVEHLMPEVACYDPSAALDGGEDGLFFYRRLAGEGGSRLAEGGVLLTEIGAGQADEVTSIFSEAGWTAVDRLRDFADIERVLVFTRRL